MIKVNTNHITNEEPVLIVSGQEDPAFLELGSGDDAPSPDGKLAYTLSANMAGNDLLVTGTLSLKINAVCGRCLERFPSSLKVGDVCHLYEGVAGQVVDISDDIREDVLLAMPQIFHCSEDCLGFCSGCGVNLNREKCRCSSPKKSKPAKNAGKDDAFSAPSPWAALDALDSGLKKTPSKPKKNVKKK